MALLSDVSLRRPVLAMAMNIVIVMFGAIGFYFLGVREFPAIDPPVVTVRTAYTGANADVVEAQITEPLEKSINGIAGIRTISSSSALGSSTITVEFNLGVDLEQAANDVRDKAAQALRNLPQDIDAAPTVTKSDADSDPIIFMPVQSSSRDILALSDYAENILQERLQTIPGVSQVQIYGLARYAMRLWIDPVRLAGYGLDFNDVRAAIDRENVELPSGKIRGDAVELTVKSSGRMSAVEDFESMTLRNTPEGVIRFRDVGDVTLGAENEETNAKKNGQRVLSLAIIPQPGANHIDIANEFYRRLEIIRKDLPADITLEIGLDKTQFVRRAIQEVEETMLIAIALVILIVYGFFRNWTIAVRPLIDIPISLIATFFVMYAMGYSINVLTLLAIVLATGLVVDDGIVVTENIFKKMEKGLPKMQAAIEGSREIYFAVISTSLTLAVVFLPVMFLQGFVGSLFREFGVVIAAAVIISAFVSLTVTPILNVKFSGNVHRRPRIYTATEPFFLWLDSAYRAVLTRWMRARWLSFVVLGLCAGAIVYFGLGLQSELAPLEDRGNIRTPITAPEGTDYDEMDRIVSSVAQDLMDSVPELRIVFAITSPSFSGAGSANSGFCSMYLVDPSLRERSQKQIAQQLGKMYSQYSDARAFPVQEQTISTGFRAASQLPVQFVLQNLNFNKLQDKLPQFLEAAENSPVFQGVDVNLKFTKPELTVSIDRERAADLGVSAFDAANALQLALAGRRLSYFYRNGKQYPIIAQVNRIDRNDPLDLAALSVRNSSGALVRLDNIVRMEESASPPQILHYNRFKAATVSAGLAPGKTIGDGVKEMEAIADAVLDDSFTTALTGASRDFAESSSNTAFAFILALALIYLVLAAQFESFRDPFVIMLTVPLAIAGALTALYVFGHTLNIFSEIGIIMLVGLVTKNGILIVEFANKKRDSGLSIIDAALEAAAGRLRPILMTSLATSLGALPIALALGNAAQSRVPLGIVVASGVLFSLVFTLFVIPGMYSYIAKKQRPTLAAEGNDS